MKINDYQFDELNVVLMMEKHQELLKVLTDQNFKGDLDELKLLIRERFLHYKAKLALKKVFKAIQEGSEAIQTEYDNLPYTQSKIEPVDGSRFYVWKIGETNGEYEYTHKGVVELDEKQDPDKWLDEYTSEFYSGGDGEWDESCRGYWFNGVLTCAPDGIQEITKDEYEVVKRYF